MPRLPTLIAVLILLTVSNAGAGAQDATPAGYPLTPDPADCRVEPRPIESVVAVVDTPIVREAGTATNPPPFVRPQGEPADDATTEAVVATVHELFACANAGDFLRIYAHFTDEYLHVFLAGTPMNDEVIAYFTASPVPLPDVERRIIVRLGEVQLLPDGRAGLVVVLDEPDDPRTEEPDYIFLEQVGDRWLVDEVVEDGGLPGTPSPGTPVR
jgi:hypothetical protein